MKALLFLLGLSVAQLTTKNETKQRESSTPTEIYNPSLGKATEEAKRLLRHGMKLFVEGEVEASIDAFDAAEEADASLNDQLWQRGLAYYYSKRYAEAAKQFEEDVVVNPDDTEELMWYFMSLARLEGPDEARRKTKALRAREKPFRGEDHRPYIRTINQMFAVGDITSVANVEFLAMSGETDRDRFYASLYRGLYAEAMNDPAESQKWIAVALTHKIKQPPTDFLYMLARIHHARRPP
eukprot:CAMPEP_0119276786 /NCGR_PEP_ID=MMETSP1329-20130426/15961_1 /TAXON_ID=114041 /ORGANISM="Genus nov. species nov., Strain RCC1024" /LENGTH=238 /DNA_ID=CAMNT_0007277223 /DNA_START=129 /DNA_END=841 /DNA_ORIENTATION=+